MNEAQKLQEDLGATKTVKLKYPARLATGQTLTELTLRRPKVGDIRAAAHLNTDAEQELFIFARLTGLVPEDLDALDFADYKEVQRVFRLMQESE
ncbi:phage tail assembly protein [Neisseria chenwenguii]|uniref:phage tail assembly protein n=1 Tax=Neisseria chenwenguii TaxID=1853278 RepID=UPI000F4FE877|nr:phage tail assembly protein [Neisseria chenwenguii]ROV57145.1 phage tail assembly protein [Neisseria chenwenguii]